MSNLDKLRLIWDGEIPISFSLAGDEISTVKQPDSVFLMICRQNYLPLCREKLTRYFSSFVNEPENIWFEYQGQPIKWHYPVGLLYDMFDSQLPWKITVHLKNFPEETLVNYSSTSSIESRFMMTVKEADCMKHAGQVVGDMQERQHRMLWKSLIDNNFDDFWSVNNKLMVNKDKHIFKHIPFRIHMRDKPYIQELYKPLKENGAERTLRDLLENFVPEILSDGYRVIIHGCEFPLVIPLQWASEHLSYADNFLHIVLRQEDSSM